MLSAPAYFPRATLCSASLRSLAFRHRVSFVLTAFVAALFVAVPTARAQSAAPQFLYSGGGPSHMIWAYQLNTTTGALTPVTGSPFNVRLNALAIAVNPAGTFLFAANDGNNVSVYAINTATGAIAEIPNSPFATGLGLTPAFMATDPNGKFLYVANQTFALAPDSLSGEIDAYAINSTTGELTPTPNSTPPSIGAIVSNDLSGIYVHPNGRWIYFQSSIDNFSSETVQGYVMDPTTGDLTNSIPAFLGPGQADGLTGDFGGHFLVSQFGTCVHLETLGVSSIDGSLSDESDWTIVGAAGFTVCFGGHSMAVDSTGNFMVLSLGTFSVPSIEPAQVVPNQPIDNGPWLADPIGPFFFASGNTYRIDSTTGTLTQVPGGSFTAGAMVLTGFASQTLAPGAQFSPGILQFTNTAVGAPGAPQEIDLVNTGTATLNITGISVTGANSADFMQSNTCAATLAPGAKCAFTVEFTPSGTLPESASIRVTDDAPGSPHLAPLTSTGVITTPPSPSLNPTSLTFPSTSVGSTASMSFNIMNSGDQTLTVSSVSIGGANPGDFSQTNSCGGSVSGNSSCPVTVTFQPLAAGQRTATVTVSYAGSGPQTEMLTGSGVFPFTVAPTGPTSISVPPGQPANFTAGFTPSPTFSGTATFACSVTPVGPGCSVSPAMLQIAASNNPATMPVKLTVNAPAAAAKRRNARFAAGAPRSTRSGSRELGIRWPFAYLGFVLMALVAIAKRSISKSLLANSPSVTASSRRLQWSGVAALLAIAALCASSSCGGGSSAMQPQPQNYKITLTTTTETGIAAVGSVIVFDLTVQ
jgi:hypothetical protein